jgi:hypothetical protein
MAAISAPFPCSAGTKKNEGRPFRHRAFAFCLKGAPRTPAYFEATLGPFAFGAGTAGAAGGEAMGATLTGVMVTLDTSPLTASFRLFDDVGLRCKADRAEGYRLKRRIWPEQGPEESDEQMDAQPAPPYSPIVARDADSGRVGAYRTVNNSLQRTSRTTSSKQRIVYLPVRTQQDATA